MESFLPKEGIEFIYYDQLGCGNSDNPKDTSLWDLPRFVEEVEQVRTALHLDKNNFYLLGHSWGGVLAMEYAIRYPDRVSHLLLMNTAPASRADYLLLLRELPQKRGHGDIEKMKALAASAEYAEGDLEADAEYYRIHFRATLRQSEQIERVVRSLRLSLTPEGILKSRRIEARLYDETWLLEDYNLLPQLERLRIPTLIIHGDHDHIPGECAAHIAQAISGSRLVVLEDCGHFSYLERPEEVRQEITEFFDNHRAVPFR